MAAWRSGNGVGRIKVVTLRRARLTLTYLLNTGMGDDLRTDKPLRHATSHSGQLSLLPYTGRKMSTGHSEVILCGWGVKAAWLIP